MSIQPHSPSHLVAVAAHDPLVAWVPDRVRMSAIAFTDREHFVTQLLESSARGCVLELAGLTGSEHRLSFHGRALDTEIHRVRAFYRGLVDHGVFERLDVRSVQLSGCVTAVGERARRTIAQLSEILGVEVVGTDDLMTAREVGRPFGPVARGTAYLDLETLPARTAPSAGARVLTPAQGRQLLSCVRRDAGTVLPELLALPLVTVALPLGHRFHELELLLDFEYLRAGDTVWPVDDPRLLRATCGTP